VLPGSNWKESNRHVDVQPQSAIAGYVASFDVCLNLFQSDASPTSSPLNVSECLERETRSGHADRGAFCRQPAGQGARFVPNFCVQIDRRLQTDVQTAAADRRGAAASSSWARLRVNEFCESVPAG
jgi:hypothetical protein